MATTCENCKWQKDQTCHFMPPVLFREEYVRDFHHNDDGITRTPLIADYPRPQRPRVKQFNGGVWDMACSKYEEPSC